MLILDRYLVCILPRQATILNIDRKHCCMSRVRSTMRSVNQKEQIVKDKKKYIKNRQTDKEISLTSLRWFVFNVNDPCQSVMT